MESRGKVMGHEIGMGGSGKKISGKKIGCRAIAVRENILAINFLTSTAPLDDWLRG